eukprot:Nitzschia sp. Nitz4//scaffold94_size78252//21968//22996//NITZ4_005463-RA/size78252-processed-gene-0.6-mRNA-1//1//CDS//3329560365//2054//frame0
MKFLPPLPNGSTLELSTVNGILGGSIWPSASILCQYLMSTYYYHPRNDHPTPSPGFKTGFSTSTPPTSHAFRSWNVLELGSGTGAVGIFAARLGVFRRVFLTEHKPPLAAAIPSVPYSVDGTLDWDLLSGASEVLLQNNDGNVSTASSMHKSDRLLKNLETNVQNNEPELKSELNVSWPPPVRELDWSNLEHADKICDELLHLQQAEMKSDIDPTPGFNLLLASDVTYVTEMHHPLASTIERLLPSQDKHLNNSAAEQDVYDSPHCLLAHQPRVWSFQGHDHQLESFQQAIQQVGLSISLVHQQPKDSEDSSGATSNQVEIFRVSRPEYGKGKDTFGGNFIL